MPTRERQLAEQSVIVMAGRGAERASRRMAASAERVETAAALHRPLLGLIASDPAAAKALDAARSQLLAVGDLERPRARTTRAPGGRNLITFDASEAPEIFVIPYHYNWMWQAPTNVPLRTSFADRSSGDIGLDARLDARPGFVDAPFVTAHAGFGIGLRTDFEVQARASAMHTVGYRWAVSAGIFGNATTEGGEELTVMQEGLPDPIAVDQSIVYHKRVSGSVEHPSESADADSGGIGTGEFLEVSWTMRPGIGYTFNVGQFITCERHPGAGGAASIAQIQGTVILMTLFR
jgi:hypothetical protein